MKKVSGKKYFLGIHNYEQTTGQPYGSWLIRSNPVSSNDKTLSLFEDYSADESLGTYLLPGEEDKPGFLSRAYDSVTSFVGDQAHKFWIGVTNPGSAHNMFWERQTESALTSAENDLANANINLKDLDDVQEYINDVNNYKSLVQRLNNGEDVYDEVRQLETKIKDKQDFYKTEGKKSSTLVDLFFDPNKSNLSATEVTDNMLGLTSKEWNTLNNSAWYDLGAGAVALNSRLDKALSSLGEGANKLLPEFITGNTNGEFTRRYIAGTDPNDRSTDRFFASHVSGNDINKLQEKVNNYRDIYERNRNEADLEVKKQLDYLLNGAWYFNPNNIDPEYRRLQEGNRYGFLGFLNPANLPYSFAELGSSWGDITHAAGSMAADAFIAWLAKYAIKKLNPYVAAGTTTVDALTAIKNAQRGERIAENINFLGGALATTSTVYFTKEMRRWETNSEAMDAYSNRVLDEAMNRGLDIDGILSRSNQYLNSIGIDTEGLDRVKQTQLALAYNSPTDDEDFEDLKHDSRQGLSHLVNSNNALAFMDYIQVLPFMNYTKSFLRDFGNKGFRKASKGATPYTPNNLRKMGEDRWIAEDEALKKAIDPTLRAEFDRQIDRVAKKWIKNPKNQLMLSHGSKFLSKKASQLFPLMTKEGIEEGQQYLLQERFQRGEYDNDDQAESMFSLPSLIDTAELAADAVAGYIGINFGDPNNGDDELRRSMEIGAMTAMWFRAPHAVTNLFSNEMNERISKYTAGILGDTEHENIRNLLAQFKNDKIIGKIVAENYGKNQDDEHVGIFFDGFSKGGVNRDRLATSLEDFKQFKGPGVTDDYIDKDIKLLNTAWNVYNNPLTDSILQDLGVEKDSSNHRNYVQLATRAIIDANEAGILVNEDSSKYQEQKNKFINEALGILENLEFENTVAYTGSTNSKLIAAIKKISSAYDEVLNISADAYNKYTASEKAKQDAIKELEKEKIEKDVTNEKGEKSYSDTIISDKIKEIADRKFDQSKEDFVRNYLEDVFNYNYLKQARQLRSLFANREKLLEYIQKELGTDINYERLTGMIHELDNSVKDYSNSVKGRISELNSVRRSLGLEEVDEEQVMNEYSVELPGDIIKQMGVWLINNALYQTLNTAATAYITGQGNPNNLRRTQRKPSWNELTDEQRLYYTNLYLSLKKEEDEEVTEKQAAAQYNKERREYNKRMRELQKEYNELTSKNKGDEEDIPTEDERTPHEVAEEAAKLYIESELQTRIDRKKIAHKEYLDERPILYDDISAATDGNAEAQKKVVHEAEKQKEEEKKIVEEETVAQKEEEGAVQPEEEGEVREKDESKTIDTNEREDESLDTYDVEDQIEEGTINTSMSDDEKFLRDIYSFKDPDEDYQNLPKGKKERQEEVAEEATVDGVEQESADIPTNFDNGDAIVDQGEESASLESTDRYFDGSVDGENIPNKRSTVTDHKEVSFNYIDQTFFYLPEVKGPDGEMIPNEEVPILQVGKGNPIKLLDGAELRSPAELSQKLSQNGWFETTKKYYVIAADNGHVDMSNPDSLVVAMIIQDGKNAYAVFMRGLAKKYKDSTLSVPSYDREYQIKEDLRHQFDLPEYRGNSEEAIENRMVANKQGRRSAFLNHNPEAVNPTEKQINDWYNKAPQDQRDDALDEARRIMSGGRSIHTERHISQLIQKLREARQQIIDACVQKGRDGKYIILTEGYKVVEPAEARISNGKINTQQKDGKHTFRSLTDGGFGMATDAQDLTKQLNEDEIEIGVGVGMNAPEGQENTIVHIDEDRQGSWDPAIGIGKAGKIYIITQAPSGNNVPIMLREARLDNDNPQIQPDQVIEQIDENGKIKEGQTPTVAEFIFRVLTHTFDARQFGMKTPDPRLLDELLEILVNNGEHTIIDKRDQTKLQYFAKKQLWFDARNVLHIALPNKDGVWKLTKITKSMLFDPKFEDRYGHTAEENRRKVIAAIALNFHWNTERDVLSMNMATAYPSLFNYLRSQFQKNKDLKEFTFFDIDGLTFKRDEMFDENMKPKKFSHLAWMFTNGKLMTDVGTPIFKHPFVFGGGTKSVSPAEEARYQAAIAAREQGHKPEEKGGTGLEDIGAQNIIVEQEKNSSLQNIVKRMSDYDGRQTGFTPAQFGQHVEQMIATPAEEARKILDEAGFEDAALLDVPVWYLTGEHISDEDIEKGLNEAIAKYVAWYNKNHNKKIKASDFKYDIRKGLNQTPIWRSEVLPVIGVKKNGKTILSFMDSMQIMNFGKKKNFAIITGVYSSGRGGSGRVDSNTARSWIQEAFGLTEDQIIITNAILKSTEGKEVFGVTQISADLINDEARVQFTLSKNAGHGIQFHEAFHYVNLLLHNKAKRQQIYDNYRKNHIFRRNWSDERIEEALAEQFRRYAQMRIDLGILPSLKRMFNNVLDFAFQYRKRTLMRQIYDDILRGGYKGNILDKESVAEFKKAYPRGATSMNANIPNLRKDIAENFQAINTYTKFYQCAESLANSYIHFVLSQTVEDTIKAGKDSFQRFLDDLEDRTEFGRSPYVQDILDNPIAFKYLILGVLKKYGIKGKTKSLKKYQEALTQDKVGETLEQREAEDRYENTWDIDHFELSVKDNVAFRAKLFLSQIPNGKFDDVTRQWVPVEDELLGTQSYVSYDEAYRLTMDYLSNYSTFEAIKKRAKDLSKVSAFFYALNNALDRIKGDIELENQLANTIKKQTPKISFIESSRPKPKHGRQEDEENVQDSGSEDTTETTTKAGEGELLDQDKQLDIRNDNTLRPLRATLRSWSLFAYSGGLFRYSEKEKANVVSSKTAYDLQDMLNDILFVLKKKSSKITEEEASKIVQEVTPKLLDLINKMGIPFDETVLATYIDDHIESGDYGNSVERYKAIQEILGPQAKRGGNIRFFINLLVKNAEFGNTQFKHSIFKTPRAFYTIYEQFAANTEIGRMATAYNAIHPNSSEHSVTVPGGKTMYPTNENNTTSDMMRWINENFEGRVDKMLDMPYSANSAILNVAKQIQEDGLSGDLEFKLNLFVGMKDNIENKGEDYFGITPMEDTVSKMMMIHNNMFVLPTMADKKTYYAIELLSRTNNQERVKTYFEMPHDILTYEKDSEDGLVVHQRFSKNTLDRFVGYFADEIKSLKQYYQRENIAAVVKDPNKLKENFHGNVSGGRMDFSGNGGLFRYFYDLLVQKDEEGNPINLNQLLEFAYKRQQFAEDPEYGDGVYWIREGSQELDGFELVRRKLNEIEKLYFDEAGEATDRLYDDINSMLFARIGDALIEYSTPGNNQLLNRVQSVRSTKGGGAVSKQNFYARSIPRQLLVEYQEMFKEAGIKNFTRDPYNVDQFGDSNDLALSVIGNYVVGQMISIIEVEKILSGDPAFFKYKYSSKLTTIILDGAKADVRVLKEKDTDKIKRLGSILSPGSEIRTDYPPEILAKYPELTSKYYTVANISDVSAKSIYIDELKLAFGKQILADYVRNHSNEKWVENYINNNGGTENTINSIYQDNKFYYRMFLSIPADLRVTIERQVKKSISPYEKITVADAEVMIRPALYRKIRIGLGQWSFTKHPIKYRDVDGTWRTIMYSDEEAFKILEEDGTWMSDPEKAAMVSQFEGFPLKMTYFSNDPGQLGQENPLTVPVYNKMAIFPVFKYMFRSTTGQQIYDRMNMDQNEIDMLTFESAVKVGLDKKKYSPYEKKTLSLATLNEGLNKKSSKYISQNDWSTKTRVLDDNTIAVEVQNLDNLRMLLNTESHSDTERSLGTQMFKIMLANIYDDEIYGLGTEHERRGGDIRQDIMSCINALTIRGVHRIKKQFYVNDGVDNKGFHIQKRVDENKVRQYISRILENNGVGATSEEIIAKGNKVASLMARKLIEQSVSALVNGEVIDINTNGGSAIQQSVFGFISFDANTLRQFQEEKDAYPVLNDGRELVWNEKDGSMEVMLSMNFFREVVPKRYQNTPDRMRHWLIENDIIKGLKDDGTWSNPKPFGIGYRIPTQGLSSTFAFTVADVIPSQSGDVIVVPREFTAQTGSDFDVDKLFIATKSYKNGKLEQTDLTGDELVNATDGAIRNKMLENYINIVTDPKSFSNARASIDVITDVIKDEVLSVIRGNKGGYPPSMYELTPQFQSRRKQEFSVGKQGIGPFALNITNLALTQYAHLTMDFGEDNMTSGFHFGDLDEITCEDENGNITRISDWLSAMVNAHVDVAKDPYVFDLNVNKATYNHINFLLRAGKGKSTFLFIAQPALKEYADEVTSSGGMYGSHIEKDQKKKSNNQILDEKIAEYQKRLDKVFDETTFRSDEQKDKWHKLIKKLKANDIEWYKVFDVKAAQNALQSPYSLQGLFFQVFALKAFKQIDPYAQALSNLVRVSKVDTKKFGNDLTLHLNFINSYNNFKYGQNDVNWKLTDTSAKNEQKYGENISSKGSDFAKMLTNPGNDLQVIYKGKVFRNAEHAYQTWKSGEFDETAYNDISFKPRGTKPTNKAINYQIMVDILVAKLLQHPELIKGIDERGGLNYIINSTHNIVGDKFWESKGLNKFIEALLDAYTKIKGIDANQNNILRNTNSIDALEHYFSSTFLDTKLFSAIGMTRDILESQTYSATSVYNDLFITIMSELFGHVDYEINGYKVDGYKEVLNEDIVSAIGTAIENIIRTKMLFKYGDRFIQTNGEQAESEQVSWEEREKQNGYTGQIDFTFGGDPNEASIQIKRLFLGNKKAADQYHKNSLFDNIAALMERMKKDPTNEKYAGLVDPEGRIINELLNYLRPTPATEDHPIPRMLFAKSKINTSVDEKAKLSSSFDFLLNHPNVGVRMLARDIALYAYYSTYDTNSASSFFDLVPYEFRWQYDSSLSEGLKNRDSQEEELNVGDIIDIMCRNYYNDDNIVPRYNASIGGKPTYANQAYGEYLGGMISDFFNKTRIPSVIITAKANSKYIKIEQKGVQYLYKKVRMYNAVNDKTGKEETSWYGYVLIQKLGRHAGTTHQYEFLTDSSTPSMFEENDMPYDFDYETVEEAFSQFKEKSLKLMKKGKSLKELKLENIAFMENTYKSNSHRSVDQNISEKNAQIIVTDKDASEFSSVNIDLSKPIEEIVSKLGTVGGKINEVSISFSNSPNIIVKQSLINDYIDEQISIYSGRLDTAMSPQLRDEAIAEFKKKVESVAEENVRQRLLEDHILDLLSELEVQGVVVESAYLSFDSPVQKAAYKVLHDNDIVAEDKLFIVSKEDIKNDQVNNVLHDEQLVLSNQEEAEASVVEEFIDKSVNAQTELSEEAETIREEAEEAISESVNESNALVEPLDDPNVLAAFAQLGGINIAAENANENDPNKKNTDCK